VSQINQYQRDIGAWALRNFPNDTRQDVALGLVEEVGEICRATLKQVQGVRGSHEIWEDEIKHEIPDVFIKLCHLAEVFGYDLATLVEHKWSIVQYRESGSPEERNRV
jgi:NTP pyrophosphatase (non-canonical NTP hydrolase)